jgi:hypothetical protein
MDLPHTDILSENLNFQTGTIRDQQAIRKWRYNSRHHSPEQRDGLKKSHERITRQFSVNTVLEPGVNTHVKWNENGKMIALPKHILAYNVRIGEG